MDAQFKDIKEWKNLVSNSLALSDVQFDDLIKSVIISQGIITKAKEFAEKFDSSTSYYESVYNIDRIGVGQVNRVIIAMNVQLNNYGLKNLVISPACYYRAINPRSHLITAKRREAQLKATGIADVDNNYDALNRANTLIKPFSATDFLTVNPVARQAKDRIIDLNALFGDFYAPGEQRTTLVDGLQVTIILSEPKP